MFRFLRACQEITIAGESRGMGKDGVVPFTMKVSRFQTNIVHLFITDFGAGRIQAGVDFCVDL